ncbi:enoyl-CoA hydratase/isomerase family protein [Roseateles depolymerans]|uniref:3-hydroxybutyryl-CoA dehydratase n=1 Tax=Roseateles depolymerans TaxID=76731 RepID=A0A0U2TY58_9BURK|nr:enoyl-CoA hydratase/isomerase family protein [Roseateles depolymerans]ALV05089.1 3-hydroxybutyryl-CoA dehydratase [Roseateles depolymerans]REG14897.1 enoyl-CoA hydratase/carnithine racemase [Roseateles depolymerans]
MAHDKTPSLDIDGPLARITLRRPEVANRLELADLEALQAQLKIVNDTESVRVLLLQAQGRHFCSGFHIDAMPGVDAGALFERLTDAWENARPVTVAAIQGGVYGGATDLALACDFRLGVNACEMFVPAARLGLHFYRGGMERYVQRLGLATAKRLLLAGESFDAPAMLAMGYLDSLHADGGALEAAADALCRQLAAMAPLALAGMKRHLNAMARGQLDRAALQADIDRCNASDDLAEGIKAWRDKRVPTFQGR